MAQLVVDSQLLESARDIFHYPDPQIMQEYMDDILRLLQWGEKRDVPGADKIINDIEQGELDWEDLQIDYTALFLNSFPQAKAHPFAGWYLGDKVLFGENEQNMRALYAAHGVLMDEEITVPADHIMVELEFAALLMDSYERTGDSNSYFVLQEVVNNHMNRWIPLFVQEIRLHANSDFYQTVATLLLSVLFELQEEMKGVA